MKNVIIKAGVLFLSLFSAAQAETAATDKKSAEEYDVLQSDDH
ncbi:hypothetical protein ACISK3_09910 [Morganella morganii]